MWVGSFQSKTDHFLISLATPCFLLLAGETSSYFSYFHGSLNSLASAKNHWAAALRGNVRAVTSRQQKPLIADVTFILLLGQLNGAGR